MVGLLAFLVTHFLVLLGVFPAALVVVFSGTLGVSFAGGLVASSPGSQASGSLPRPGIQLQLKGSEMESRPGVSGRWEERTGKMADTIMTRSSFSSLFLSHLFVHYSFTHSRHQHLSSIFYDPGTVPDAGDTVASQT